MNKKELLDTIKTFFIAAIIAVLFRTIFFTPYHIPSPSMNPLLLAGDYIFISKYPYGYSRFSLPFGINLFSGRINFHEPKRGDVIVFTVPSNPSIQYIKRLIGLPGDTVQVKDGILYINGEEVKRVPAGKFIDEYQRIVQEYTETLPNGVSYTVLDYATSDYDNTEEYHVPHDHYFFMGDNRDRSGDSRVLNHIGYVPKEGLIGRAEFIFFSSESAIWKIWNWPFDLRLDRFFNKLRPTTHE